MKKRNLLCAGLILSGCFLVSCTRTLSGDGIATAIAETAQAEAMRMFYEAQTAEAQATDTPEPTATDTPIPTDTPLPSSTPTPVPPAGMAYVPDFIGMHYDEASDILIEMESERWYFVHLINKDVDEWTVYIQEPEPGTLFDLKNDRVKIIVSVYAFTPTPTRVTRPRDSFADSCGGVTYQGYCESYSEVVWCEDNQLWIWDCAAYCSGGYCGYYDAFVGYTCFCP